MSRVFQSQTTCREQHLPQTQWITFFVLSSPAGTLILSNRVLRSGKYLSSFHQSCMVVETIFSLFGLNGLCWCWTSGRCTGGTDFRPGDPSPALLAGVLVDLGRQAWGGVSALAGGLTNPVPQKKKNPSPVCCLRCGSHTAVGECGLTTCRSWLREEDIPVENRWIRKRW